MKSLGNAFACAGLALSLASCTTTPGSEYRREHAVVQFSYEAVRPETVRIASDGNVTWVNLAADSRGFVVFPASISSGFTCGEALHPYFQEIPGGYQSLPVTRFESARVELPCPLKPGSYAYEIWLMGTGLGETIVESPERKLGGKIVVE